MPSVLLNSHMTPFIRLYINSSGHESDEALLVSSGLQTSCLSVQHSCASQSRVTVNTAPEVLFPSRI